MVALYLHTWTYIPLRYTHVSKISTPKLSLLRLRQAVLNDDVKTSTSLPYCGITNLRVPDGKALRQKTEKN